MAGIDIILNADDAELIWLYKSCMVTRFQELRLVIGHYHPRYEVNSIPLGKKLYNLQSPTAEFILKEMWKRYLNSPSFAKKCWWESINIFQTKISLPREDVYIPTNVSNVVTPKETIIYDSVEYVFLSGGSKRKVYVSPDKTHVIKVSMDCSTLGIEENITEAKIYSENKNSIYAKCELVGDNWLKMEYVEPVYFKKGDDYPDWTLYIAEHQVGYNKDGVLLAYDYGSEI